MIKVIASVTLLLLGLVGAGDTDKRVTVERNEESGYSVEVSVSTVFPTITVTPANDSEGFCRYTLVGIFESEANEGFYDPRTDYDIANSRVALDGIEWRIEKGAAGAVSVVGVPRSRRTDEEAYAFDEDEGDIVELAPNENEEGGEGASFSRFRLALTANEGANGAQMGVTIEDYAYYRDTAETVLVLEWSVDAGYAIGEENVTRERRSVAMGGCGYDAGPDADDGTAQPVRCEVRPEASEDGDAVTVYQSYVHFSGQALHQPNVSLSATPRDSGQRSPSAQAAPLGSLLAATALLAMLFSLSLFFDV